MADFFLKVAAFASDENNQQNQGDNRQEEETHAVDGFTILGFREDLGAVGEEPCNEINRGYDGGEAKVHDEYSPPVQWLFHKGIRYDLSSQTCSYKQSHHHEKLRDRAFLVAENVSVFQFSHDYACSSLSFEPKTLMILCM